MYLWCETKIVTKSPVSSQCRQDVFKKIQWKFQQVNGSLSFFYSSFPTFLNNYNLNFSFLIKKNNIKIKVQSSQGQ